jgi:NADPH:quinone reductase-like Zn-dependent oxidoreductase
MGTQQIHAAVLHGIGQTPRYERFPAPVAGDGEAVVTVTAAALKPSDRLMANGVHYAPTTFPQVVGLDGVGRLQDGTRVAFFAPKPPTAPWPRRCRWAGWGRPRTSPWRPCSWPPTAPPGSPALPSTLLAATS